MVSVTDGRRNDTAVVNVTLLNIAIVPGIVIGFVFAGTPEESATAPRPFLGDLLNPLAERVEAARARLVAMATLDLADHRRTDHQQTHAALTMMHWTR